jgi:acetyl-CoA carboxylase carboxyl transferase alpha subunit
VTLKDDCRQLKLVLQRPDINQSEYHFSVPDERTILYGLGAIKGVGRAAVESLIAERHANGPYQNLVEFCRRVDHDKINRRALEAMVKSGAMDSFGESRRSMMHQVPEALKSADQEAKAAAAGQNDMFGIVAAPVAETQENKPPQLAEWQERMLLNAEKEALGLYLTGHPFDAVRNDARYLADGRLGDITAEPPPQTNKGERNYAQAKREATIAGLIVDVRKRGNRVSVVLDDDTARMEVSLFSEAFQEFRHLLVKDEIVIVTGGMRYDDFMGGWTINVKNVLHIDRVIESRAKSMVLSLSPNGKGENLLVQLHDLLLPFRKGNCDVSVRYIGDRAAARLSLGPEWSVRPSRELRDKLTELLGNNNVRLLYAPASKRHTMDLKFLDFEQPIAELEAKIDELRYVGDDSEININEEVTRLKVKSESLTKSIFAKLSPWQVARVARHESRPYTQDYLSIIAPDFQELHGDRMYADDPAVIGGVGRIDGRAVMFIGHQKGRDTKERVRRNYGMPKPEGYRKAQRLMRMAEKFSLPVVTFIDTPGAYPGVGAEERGQSEAIAHSLYLMAGLKTPIVCVVIGEGGSGGALAIGVGDKLLMLQYSIYSVISPEGCASILWKSADKAEEAAEAMRITAPSLNEYGLVDEVLVEPLGGAHRNPKGMAEVIRNAVLSNLDELTQLSTEQLLEKRQRRLASFGQFKEG